MRAYHSLVIALLVGSLGATGAWAAPLRVEVYRPAGTPDALVVRGRAFRDRASRAIPAGEGAAGRALRKNAGALLTDETEGAKVEVQVAGRTGAAVTDDDGFFEVRFAFDPIVTVGEHPIRVSATVGEETATGDETALVRPLAGELLILTDFDDTLVHTHVTRKGKFLEAVFLKDAATVPVVPRMAGLLRCLVLGRSARGAQNTSLHYLSASPVNFHGKLAGVLSRHGFPLGAIHLRHLELKNLSDSSSYKLAKIETIAARFPDYPILLMGDGGEKDPEVYRAAREKLGGRVKLILIRKVEGEDESEARFEGMARYDTGADAAVTLIEAGLLHPACAEYRPPSRTPAVAPTKESPSR